MRSVATHPPDALDCVLAGMGRDIGHTGTSIQYCLFSSSCVDVVVIYYQMYYGIWNRRSPDCDLRGLRAKATQPNRNRPGNRPQPLVMNQKRKRPGPCSLRKVGWSSKLQRIIM